MAPPTGLLVTCTGAGVPITVCEERPSIDSVFVSLDSVELEVAVGDEEDESAMIVARDGAGTTGAGLITAVLTAPVALGVPSQTIGQESLSTSRLDGTQLHIRMVLPRRIGRLSLVVCPASNMLPMKRAASALVVKALIWRESWTIKWQTENAK